MAHLRHLVINNIIIKISHLVTAIYPWEVLSNDPSGEETSLVKLGLLFLTQHHHAIAINTSNINIRISF